MLVMMMSAVTPPTHTLMMMNLVERNDGFYSVNS